MEEKLCRRGWNEADASITTPLKVEEKILKKEEIREKNIPIFFATDDNYLPFLGVALQSIKENASKDYTYEIFVLHSGVSDAYKRNIEGFSEKGFQIQFVNVSEKLKEISAYLHIRDYYTCTTYFRVFIAEMFPDFDKAIYLDCDVVVIGDISELYSYDLGNNLIGGAPCEGVNSFEIYKEYVRKVDGLNPDYFFNAGVLLMNLKGFREEGFYSQFAQLLQRYKFTVIQDEDYLNVLCQDRVLCLPRVWNKFPITKENLERKELRIVHYGMTWKPWHYGDIPYQEYFWEYAQKTVFYPLIKEVFDGFSQEDMARDKDCEFNLKELAKSEILRTDGYFNVYGKQYGKR